jgi:outer membrane lipoprotein-sorting protein
MKSDVALLLPRGRNRRFRSLVAALAAIVSAAAAAGAAEFSADVKVTRGDSTMTGKLYVKGGNARQEMVIAGAKTVMILLSDKKVLWVLDPAKKTYMERRGKNVPDLASFAEPKVPPEVGTRKLVGKEKVVGYLCDKYALVFKDKQQLTIYLWVSPKLKFPLKTEQRVGGKLNALELKNIREGGVTDSLFQRPAGYRKTANPAGLGAPGPSAPGGT